MESESRSIPLTRGKVAIVDASDYDMLSSHRWYATEKGYAAASVKRVNVRMHRLIMGLERGDRRQIDHINGDRADNRRCNLRICDLRANNCNRRTFGKNKTGYKGVTLNHNTGVFSARIDSHGVRNYLGSFATAEDAHAAYCKAVAELHGEFANYE
jgi:hypothetical protein